MEKIKLVVVNENTLGYIDPRTPNNLSILRALGTKGSRFNNHSGPAALFEYDTVRLASEKDFDNIGVCFEGYGNDYYEYEKS